MTPKPRSHYNTLEGPSIGGRPVSNKEFLKLFPEKDLIDFYFLDDLGLVCTRQLRKRVSDLIKCGYIAKYDKIKVVKINTDEFLKLRGLYVYVITQKGLAYRAEKEHEITPEELALKLKLAVKAASAYARKRQKALGPKDKNLDDIDESTQGTTKEILGVGVTRFYNMYLRTTRKDPVIDPKTLVNSVFMLGSKVNPNRLF